MLLLSTATLAQGPTFRIPFHTVNGQILLDGQLNGKPAALLLDSGANNSIVDAASAGASVKLDKRASARQVNARLF